MSENRPSYAFARDVPALLVETRGRVIEALRAHMAAARDVHPLAINEAETAAIALREFERFAMSHSVKVVG